MHGCGKEEYQRKASDPRYAANPRSVEPGPNRQSDGWLRLPNSQDPSSMFSSLAGTLSGHCSQAEARFEEVRTRCSQGLAQKGCAASDRAPASPGCVKRHILREFAGELYACPYVHLRLM